MEVTIALTDEQVKAIKMLDLTNEVQELCEKAIATSIRGKFKYYMEKAEHEAGRSYDWATAHGAVFDIPKNDFVVQFMKDIRTLMNRI